MNPELLEEFEYLAERNHDREFWHDSNRTHTREFAGCPSDECEKYRRLIAEAKAVPA